MKIQYLLTWADAVGGTERAVLRQASWLAARHDVEVVSVFQDSARPAFALDERVRVRYLLGRDRRPTAATLPDDVAAALDAAPSRFVDASWEGAFTGLTDLAAQQALAETDADVVVSTTPALLALAAQVLPPRVLLVHQEHRVAELRGTSGGPYERYTARADAIVLLSEATRGWFAERFGAAAPRLEVIPNSLDPGFRPASGRRGEVVVWAGRLSGEKQPVHAVRAFAEATREHPGWRLRLFGDGPKAAEVQREATALGVAMRVELMGVSRSMDEEWARASVAVLTSRNESFGLVLAEAMAAGVPCVAYDCPNGPGEIITDGENGFLVPADDVEALADALRRVIDDVELRDRLGDNALASTSRFELDTVMKQWDGLFTELLADHDPAAVTQRRLLREAYLRARGSTHVARHAVGADASTATDGAERWAATVEARHPGLAWAAGQLARVSDVDTAEDVARANLRFVAEALEDAGVPYVLVRRQSLTHRVAVLEADRPAALEALRAAGRERPVYVEPRVGRDRSAGVWPAYLLGDVPPSVEAHSYQVFEPVVTSSRTLRFGAVYGCTLEVWTDSDDGEELLAPKPTPLGSAVPKAAMVPATVRLGGREYRTVEPLVDTLPTEITFPIDVVYTWVDGDDPAWQARRQAVTGHEPQEVANGAARFRSRDELRYSLRSLDLFAPWVNRIWIVTDAQTPGFLDTLHPKVRVVDHREIFTDPAALPTFNSHAIETQLHHIEGLSEHFLYFNDDVFVGRPVDPGLFFTPGGLTRFFPSPTQVPPTPVSDDDEFNITAAKNNRELLRASYGRTLRHAFLHAPMAHRRSTLYAMEKEFPEAFDRTMRSRVRTRSDISVASSFAHYFGLVTGRAVTGEIRCSFVNVGLQEHRPRLTRLLDRRAFDVFCLNDFHDGDVPVEEQQALLSAFLSAYFPVPGQYERGSARNAAVHDGR
ncbi:Stealth CR1 domain-containing protein [Planosporangium sp. 12N6]|uniref:Stealth CR1 domain-containing protein n=1 Tax=Planosporangium spinosum TaxID=3402278 RepID=UPI003CF59684